MRIHNFFRRVGVVTDAFTRVEMNPNTADAELPNEQEQIVAEINASKMQQNE